MEPARQTPVVGSYDVVACASGPSSLVAEGADARNGARTLLLEQYGFVGRTSTSALVPPTSEFRLGNSLHVGGIPLELMHRAAALRDAELDRSSGYYSVDEFLELAVQPLLVEQGATLPYHSWFSDCFARSPPRCGPSSAAWTPPLSTPCGQPDRGRPPGDRAPVPRGAAA